MLIRLLDHYFLATAKHNLYAGAEGVLIDGRTILLGSLGYKLFMFPVDGFYAGEDLDVAVALLNHDQVSRLIDRGFGFLIEPSIELPATELEETPDANRYVVFGWPQSGNQSRLNPTRRNIRQASFTFFTGISNRQVIADDGLNPESHLFLEFDQSFVQSEGVRVIPPDPVGISGGAAFHLVQGVMKLAGIMTEHIRSSHVMVAVKTSEVIAVAQYAVQRQS